MYERYCPRGPIFIFYYVFLTSHEHAITFLSKRSSQLLFVMRCYLTTSMYERSCPRSSVYIIIFYYVLPASHDHVCTLLSKRTSLFFYYVLLSTHDHVCMLLAKCCSLYFFIMCFQLATILYECITLVVRSLFLLYFQLATTM